MTTPRGSATQEASTLRLRDVLRFLLRGAPLALTVVVIAVSVAVFITRRTPAVYSADVTLVVTQSPLRVTNLEVIAAPVVDPGVYRTAIFEGSVLRDALERISERDVTEREVMASAQTLRVTVEQQTQSSLIRVAVRHGSPPYAAELANTIAEELVAWDYARARSRLMQGASALERTIAALDTELGAVADEVQRASLLALREERVEELERVRSAAAGAVYVPLIEPLSTATPPLDPVAPRPVLNVAIALVLGLAAGYGLILIVAVTNPRIANRDDLERLAGLPVLAEFPRPRGNTRRLSEEAIGWLHARLTKLKEPSTCLVIAISGLRSHEDQAAVAVSLAEAFARAGERTLLVDADVRGARTSQELGVAVARGRGGAWDAAATVGADAAQRITQVVVDRERAFDFLPATANTPRPVDTLGQLFDQALPVWSTKYDTVVLDAAPMLPFADAVVVAGHAAAVVLCVRPGVTAVRDLDRALGLLADQRVPFVGTVLTHSGAAPRRAPRR